MGLFGSGKKKGEASSHGVFGLFGLLGSVTQSEKSQAAPMDELANETIQEFIGKKQRQYPIVANYYAPLFHGNEPIAELTRTVSSLLTILRDIGLRGAASEPSYRLHADLVSKSFNGLSTDLQAPFHGFYRDIRSDAIDSMKTALEKKGKDTADLFSELDLVSERLAKYETVQASEQKEPPREQPAATVVQPPVEEVKTEPEDAEAKDQKPVTITEVTALMHRAIDRVLEPPEFVSKNREMLDKILSNGQAVAELCKKLPPLATLVGDVNSFCAQARSCEDGHTWFGTAMVLTTLSEQGETPLVVAAERIKDATKYEVVAFILGLYYGASKQRDANLKEFLPALVSLAVQRVNELNETASRESAPQPDPYEDDDLLLARKDGTTMSLKKDGMEAMFREILDGMPEDKNKEATRRLKELTGFEMEDASDILKLVKATPPDQLKKGARQIFNESKDDPRLIEVNKEAFAEKMTDSRVLEAIFEADFRLQELAGDTTEFLEVLRNYPDASQWFGYAMQLAMMNYAPDIAKVLATEQLQDADTRQLTSFFIGVASCWTTDDASLKDKAVQALLQAISSRIDDLSGDPEGLINDLALFHLMQDYEFERKIERSKENKSLVDGLREVYVAISQSSEILQQLAKEFVFLRPVIGDMKSYLAEFAQRDNFEWLYDAFFSAAAVPIRGAAIEHMRQKLICADRYELIAYTHGVAFSDAKHTESLAQEAFALIEKRSRQFDDDDEDEVTDVSRTTFLNMMEAAAFQLSIDQVKEDEAVMGKMRSAFNTVANDPQALAGIIGNQGYLKPLVGDTKAFITAYANQDDLIDWFTDAAICTSEVRGKKRVLPHVQSRLSDANKYQIIAYNYGVYYAAANTQEHLGHEVFDLVEKRVREITGRENPEAIVQQARTLLSELQEQLGISSENDVDDEAEDEPEDESAALLSGLREHMRKANANAAPIPITTDFTPYYPKFKTGYESYPQHEERAKNVVEVMTDFCRQVIEITRAFTYAPGPLNKDGNPKFESLDQAYKVAFLHNLTGYWHRTAMMGQAGLMSTALALCEKSSKPYVREVFTMAQAKPFFAYTFENFISPLIADGDPKEVARNFRAKMPRSLMNFSMQPEPDWSDEQIIQNFCRACCLYMSATLSLGAESGRLSAALSDPDQVQAILPEDYRDVWSVVNFKNAIISVKRMVDMTGQQARLSEYPNQGPALALMAFLYTDLQQVNIDMSNQTLPTQRHPAGPIARLPDTQENSMICIQTATIFENLF
ncbi:hypothetical protein AWB71_01323 [Caballeronia peredens]|nr:hypothetical protein AWB71_01323 [Caballeronia peredens]